MSRKKTVERSIFGRIVVCLLLTLLLLTVTEAQQPKKVFRIGHLSALDSARESVRAEAIRLALRELDYAEGENIVTRRNREWILE